MALVHRQKLTPEEADAFNASLPVFRLSDDLLEEIFLEVASSSVFIMATDHAMDLSHVCRRWYSVALNTGRLWSRLSGSPVLFELSLARSLSAPLNLELDTRHVSTASLVFGQVHRIVKMTLFVTSDVVASVEPIAPVLRALNLDFVLGMQEYLFLAGWSFPKLEELCLTHTSLRSNSHFLVDTLTTLELVRVDCRDPADAPGSSLFSRSFDRLRALKSLRIVHCLSADVLTIPLGHAPIRLPALQTLDVVDGPDLVLGFLRSVIIPSFTMISLDLSAVVSHLHFARELSESIRRLILERNNAINPPIVMHTAAFDILDGQISLAFWSAGSVDTEPLPKPTIHITFYNEERLWNAIDLALHLSLEDVKCLRLIPQVMAHFTLGSFLHFDATFPRIEKLVLGRAVYHAAVLLFGVDTNWTLTGFRSGPEFFPSLKTLVLMGIRSRDDEVDLFDSLARTLINFLALRAKIDRSVQTVVINDCTVFRRADIDEIRAHVHELLWDGQTMD